ncbi:MAG TPA: TonB-dependent receptor [Candidatus Eisenbacteria bacterium]|nr:TonB-dependent receptor [Candidatus Eisenbacteria bacterium]
MGKTKHAIFLGIFPFALLFGMQNLFAQTVLVEGVVRDSAGAVIPGASIELRSGHYGANAISDAQGQFVFGGVKGSSGTITARSEGFSSLRQEWAASTDGEVRLTLVLTPAQSHEEVTVSATRTETRLTDTPGSTIMLSNTEVAASPALRVDDVLRQVPGFSLFRRSDSRVANASNQGVSLRGLGGSASSRALVLEDGLPIVDAFGGWVYWNRLPRESLQDVEVFRGGASNLYGSDALGGVIQFITRQPESPAFHLETSYGSEKTPDLSFWTGARAGKWDVSLASEMFRTDGYILVPTWQRGAVDTLANSKDASVEVTLGHKLGEKGRVFGRGNFYTEFRHNGTPIQTNDTQMGEGALGLDQQFGNGDSLTLRGYGQVQGYDQRFSSVAADRNSESLTDLQYVPEQVVGGAGQWTHLFGDHQTLVAGADIMQVLGTSNEQFFSSGTHTRNSVSGGRQRIVGGFGEDLIRIKNWTVILGVRVDDWNNFNASFICTPVGGICSSPSVLYPSRSDLAFSPRLSVLRSLNQNVSVTGSIYRAFRAPTLNELYRSFRVANVVTTNNPFLNAERLTGAEAGINVTSLDRKLNVRGTFFWSDIVDPVENVTVDPTANPVLRQKQNLGRIRSRGMELDGVMHVSRDVQVSAGYAFTDATVVNYTVPPGEVSLLGNYVAQVPRNVFTWEARYWNPSRLMLSVQGRFVGNQFDDDQNQYPLGHFYTMDIQIGRNLTRSFELFAAAENLLNERYNVANTPTANGSLFNIGPPLLYRIGLRINWPAERQ